MSLKTSSKIVVAAVTLASTVLVFLISVSLLLAPEDEIEQADAIVVVSGGETDRRIKTGVELYKEGYSDTMIFSGAAAEGEVSDARAMSRIAVRQGVSEKHVIIEEEAINTLENGIHVAKIVQRKKMKSVILVTSPYHLRRAGNIFKRVLGADVKLIRVAAHDSAWSKKGWFLSETGWRRSIEEIGGLFYYYIYQKPTLN